LSRATALIPLFLLFVPLLPAQEKQDQPSRQAPLTLTLQDALSRARANSVQFQAALTDRGVAHQDLVQTRAALLPSVNYNNAYIFSQGNGTDVPRFIANNAVHEYQSEGNLHEALGLGNVADYRRARALDAVAQAKAEIAARGLVVTVVQAYYGLISAQRKYANAQQAAGEAERYLSITRKLENGGEVAHADVIKAQLQFQDRQRDLREAQLAMEKNRLELAVLLFPDFNENFTVIDDTQLAPPLVDFDDFVQAAQKSNPGLRAASGSLSAAGFELMSARGGFLPALTLDYFYGIDASRFATRTDGLKNLGYAATATLNIPVWNWGATHARVAQADLRHKQAEREMSLAQRRLLADIQDLYHEAQAAQAELEILRSSADLAAESLRLTGLRYQGGEATILELVDAQNTLVQARNGFTDGEVRYRTALANLQTLTGTM